MTKFNFLIILTLLAYTACRPNEPEPIAVEPKPVELKPTEWQTFPNLNTDNFSFVQFFKMPQKLLIFSDNYLTELDTAHRVTRQEKYSDRPATVFGMKIQTNGVFFTHNPIGSRSSYSNYFQKITVRSVASPQVQLEIDVTQIDTNYRFIAASFDNALGILTQDNRLFLPVYYSENAYSFTSGQCRFLVFKIQMVGNKLEATREPRFIPVDLNIPNLSKAYVLSTLNLPKPTDRYFYFSAWITYRMDTQTGAYEPILDIGNSKMCYHNDTLWTFGRSKEGRFAFGFLPPRQTDWTSFSTDVGNQYADWYALDKHLVGLFNYRQLALFTPKIDSNKFEIRSLADNNVSAIRDITLFNDRVYLATTQGLIVKPFKDFIVFPK
jgi:hypothetical protein